MFVNLVGISNFRDHPILVPLFRLFANRYNKSGSHYVTGESASPTFCYCSELSQLSLQVKLTAAMLHVASLSCSHLMYLVLPKESAFRKPQCYLHCRRLFYSYICITGTKPALCTANALCPPPTDHSAQFHSPVPAHSVLCPQAACILCTVRH